MAQGSEETHRWTVGQWCAWLHVWLRCDFWCWLSMSSLIRDTAMHKECKSSLLSSLLSQWHRLLQAPFQLHSTWNWNSFRIRIFGYIFASRMTTLQYMAYRPLFHQLPDTSAENSTRSIWRFVLQVTLSLAPSTLMPEAITNCRKP